MWPLYSDPGEKGKGQGAGRRRALQRLSGFGSQVSSRTCLRVPGSSGTHAGCSDSISYCILSTRPVDRPVARRAHRALSLVLRLTRGLTGGPSTQIRVSPFRHISQKGDSIRAHMSLGFGADACTHARGSPKPPKCSAPWPLAAGMHPHAPWHSPS